MTRGGKGGRGEDVRRCRRQLPSHLLPSSIPTRSCLSLGIVLLSGLDFADSWPAMSSRVAVAAQNWQRCQPQASESPGQSRYPPVSLCIPGHTALLPHGNLLPVLAWPPPALTAYPTCLPQQITWMGPTLAGLAITLQLAAIGATAVEAPHGVAAQALTAPIGTGALVHICGGGRRESR